jgi:uncharacterized protein (DUF952 family)
VVVQRICYGKAKIDKGGIEPKMLLIFKIIDRDEWAKAQRKGQFTGAAIDLADGYIHLSGANQVSETAAKYFAGRENLVLVAYEANQFGAELKWEASRGGALFPHVYGTLDPAKAVWTKLLPWNGTTHDFPEGVLA